MKKLLSGIWLALVLLRVIGTVFFIRRDLSFSSGIYLRADNGSHLIVLDSSPIVMSNRTGDSLLFDSLCSGDKIPLLRDGIQASYGKILSLNHGYDEVPSFTEETALMDEAFFRQYSLFAAYVPAFSCSFRFGLDRLTISGDTLSLYIRQTNDPDYGDCAMAGWLVLASVDKELTAHLSRFQALLA